MNFLRFSLLFFAFAVLLSGAFAWNFDDGQYDSDLDSNAVALYHCNETGGTGVFDQTGLFDATATNALIWDAGGKWFGGCGLDAAYYATQDTLMDVNNAVWTLEAWIKPIATYSAATGAAWYVWSKKMSAVNKFYGYLESGTGKLKVEWIIDGGANHNLLSTTTTWNQDQWYHIAIVYDGTGNAMYVDGIKQANNATAVNLASGTNTDFFIGANIAGAEVGNLVIDDFAFSDVDRNVTEWVFFNSPDLNFVSVDGSPFDGSAYEYSYSVDGNLTIDFNVFDSNNDRLSIDINLTALAGQGSGTAMVKDINLDSGKCSDLDWDDVPSLCSVDININRLLVSDGNYLVAAVLKNLQSSVYAWGDANVYVANDVNINIKVPIDEVTNAAIDTDVTSFIVKILQGGTLSTYSGQVDENYFSVPFGTGETIMVQIDTNRTDLYNGRIYSYMFDTTEALVVLQPYLPPVANAVLTTVHTYSVVNLNPLEGLRVKVFKDLVGGRTLIHDSLTDGKGETAIPFVIADEYEIDVYQSGVLLTAKDYTATSTTNNLYFYISDEGEIVIPEFANVSVNFLPSIRTHATRDVDVSVVVASDTLSVSAIQVIAVNNDVNIYDSGMDVLAPSDGNTYVINFDYIVAMDGNYPVEFVVIVVLENGEEFYFNEDSYWFGRGANNLITLLTIGMRTDFNCSSENLNSTCGPLLFIAFFIILFAIAGIGLYASRNGTGLTIILLILAGAFTYIAWIPLWIYVVMFIAGIGAMISMSRMD